jgi:hypothetical protein
LAETATGRRVMVRDWYEVPAIPGETLLQVYGQRTIDPRVELVDLVFEYWLRSGATQRMQREKVLEIMQGRIDASNVYDLISLMAKRGVAEPFFDLTRSSVDSDRRLRMFLLGNGVLLDTIRFYASWNGLNPKEFTDGFFVGAGESVATIVVDLVELLKLAGWMQQEWLRGVFLLPIKPEEGIKTLRQQVALIGQVFDALVDQLDPTKLPARVTKTWTDWNERFFKALEDLDPFTAGRVLGKIAGDLWQLLTGLVGLIKLLRITGKLALKYAPLLIGSVRRVAAEAAVMLRQLAQLMVAIGRAAFDGAKRIGIGTLKTLFPPDVLKALVKEGRALLPHGELTLMPVFSEAYATAFGGQMRPHFGVLISQEGRPLFMAATTDRLPVATAAEARAAIDETLDNFDELFREPGRAPKLKPSAIEVLVARMEMLMQRLDVGIRTILQGVAWDEFVKLVKSKRKFYADELGRIIHTRMKERLAAEVAQLSPGLRVTTEKHIATLIDELAGIDPDLAAAQKALKGKLSKSVASMVAGRADLRQILGVPAGAKSEKAVAKFLAKEFGWDSNTKLGDLQCDAVLTDPAIRRMVNVDWTASTKSDRFEKVWRRVLDDVGEHGFGGDWDKIADAYAKAGKPVPAEVTDGIARLTEHAVRQTIVRQTALEEILGPLWRITSHEMTYDGLGKLWKALGEAAK